MIMALPELQPNLEETDFAKNFPMDFSISTPELDLTPSFPVDVEQEVDAAVVKDGQEGKVYGDQQPKATKSKREGDNDHKTQSSNIPLILLLEASC